jgi:hypothetical protein
MYGFRKAKVASGAAGAAAMPTKFDHWLYTKKLLSVEPFS